MRVGFVLIEVAPHHEQKVYEALRKVKEIEELHGLFGEWDMLCKIVADDLEAVSEIVVRRIRSQEGVIRTDTLIGAPM
ncbi:MAG: Lrp/AsnC ligand binding domain-containing protein [Halobacteriales archaeon]|nr:Lrp/AsnC ligand binding domain-containing protein [Halobacteriales archaeon]